MAFCSFLQTLFPLIVCGTSALILVVQIYSKARGLSLQKAGYGRIEDSYRSWGAHLPAQNGDTASNDDDDAATIDDDDDESEELALAPTRSHVTGRSIIEVDKPVGEVWLVVFEELAVLGELAIHIIALVTGAWGRRSKVASIAGITTWGYVTILASMRLLFSSTSQMSFPRLWYHTAFLYGWLWLFSTLIFRSAIIHPISTLGRDLVIADFALVTVLLAIALGSRKGNKAVELEYEDDIEPSKEQVASVFSLATFSWVDTIVWKGYKKTYEMGDVWNLPPKDKAATILDTYRQVKKTNILAFHLLRYFKRELLIQAAWAALSGALTFAPTLLLKAILEFVERPDKTPRNAAWFYVVLLFASGCASALADGQALWIGRKVCIRLRAILIGEIYVKVLKRKAASSAEKVLGEEKKDETKDTKPGLLKRAMTFGKRKKKDPEPKRADTDVVKDDAQVSSGTLINLMAVDSFKVGEVSAYLHFLWANTPVQVTLAIFLLYRIMGYSSIAGIGMMALLLPINLFIAKQFASIQKQILAATDARIHTTNEVLSNIRIIKFFAWEQRFLGLVNDKRMTELMHLRRRYIWWAVAGTVWSGAPILITLLSFFVYTVVEGKDLVPSVAFTALSLFQILRIPLDQLSDMIAHVQESKVSVDRIEECLNEPETDKYVQLKYTEYDEAGDPIIGFEDGTLTWGSSAELDSSDAFKMIDLNTKFPVGQLSVVIGPTGSGKTSLLMGLLGEMTLLKGRVHLPSAHNREDIKPDPSTGLTETIAYCAQQAWLVNGTVRDNILFASPYDAKRYKEVIVACSLQRDLEILDDGDQTLVGEKGVTLSGGQKQRISLARALYSNARHVLLDDVLSAVDSHTAKWIFVQGLLGPLMTNRTCVLVTHNVALCLPHSDHAVVLENGKIVAQGTPNEVIDSGKLGEDLSKSRPVSRAPSRVPSRVPSDVGDDVDADGDMNGVNGTLNGTASKDKTGKKNSQEETKAVGSVNLRIITLYLRAMGSWYFWVAAALVFTSQQLSSVATNVWIREWANAYASKDVSVLTTDLSAPVQPVSPITHVAGISGLGTCLTTGTCVWPIPWSSTNSNDFSMASVKENGVNEAYYLGVYALLGLAFMIITLIREGVLFGGSLTASRRIHQRLMEAVTHAKFRFFDSTPQGQIMNRFSKDIEAVDQEIAPVAIGVVHCLGSIVTIVILISVITPGFLIAGVFITVLYFLISIFYINSSRDLKRLESVKRSPLYQQFGETLSGMTTIRAYGDEQRFIRENLAKINTQHRPFIYLWAANRWLAFRVDVVGALVSFFAGIFVVLSVGSIDAGAAGLALTYAVTFTENVLWFVRLYASNEQNMNSVERVKEYLDIEQEAPAQIPDNRPPSNWPSQGSVEFIGYSTRYRPDFDQVLKKVTFRINAGEKVGVVGRTGAGKSSLALALFRALEAEEGKILVDDIDIGLIGLQDLRENIVMVPQGEQTTNLSHFITEY